MRSKRKKHRRRLAVSSYPLPSPEAVDEAQRKLFSGRFVDDHLSALLGRASVVVSAEFHEDVRRHQMPIPHWRVLACLWDNIELSLSELTELTLITQPTVTRLVQRLEKKGLIRKSADGRDRRVLRVALTSLGHKQVDELIILANERQKRLLHGLDADALKAALHYLIAFCTAKRRRKRPLERMTY